MRSIEVVVREVADAVAQGKTGRTGQAEGAEAEGEQQPQRRRSSRSQFRAQDQVGGETESPETAPEAAGASN